MAQTTTTISAAVGVADLIIPVTSATGFAVGNFLKLDDEFMVVTATSSLVWRPRACPATSLCSRWGSLRRSIPSFQPS